MLTIAVAAAGAIGFLVAQGPRAGFGFLIGAVLSQLNFQGMTLMVNALLGLKKPGALAAALIPLRYVLLGAAVYGIVNILGFTLAPVLSGLFAAFAAVILDSLYELIFRPENH
jgi:hypothetical protein